MNDIYVIAPPARPGFLGRVGLAALFAATILPVAQVAAADKPAAEAEKTYTVHAEPLEIAVELSGVLESHDNFEVSFTPEQWSADLIVAEAVPHGTRVRRGDMVLKLDTRKIDQSIRDLKSEQELSELALAQAREALDLLRKSVPQQLADAERAGSQANEDLREFRERDRPRTIKNLAFEIKQNEQSLSYRLEELRQLEKMYKADDLTEETEEIVVKRARNEVEAARFSLEMAKADQARQLKIDLPRRDVALAQSVAQNALALERARLTLPPSITQQVLSLTKLQYDERKKDEQLAQLRRDRAAMTLRAPAAGIVYYGQSNRGAWPSVETASAAVAAGAQVRPGQVLLTVVGPDSLDVRATVEEAKLHQLRAGLRGTFSPAADPDWEMPATLAEFSPVPIAPGKFDATVEIEREGHARRIPVALSAGMAGTVRFVVYTNPKALVVPAEAVRTDPGEEQTYVMVQVDGKPQRRVVKTGEKPKDRVEIVSGLSAGETVLLKEEKK